MTNYEKFLTLPKDGLHVTEIARRCGVSRQTIRRWEKAPPMERNSRWTHFDYSKMDSLIGQYLPDKQIAA